MPLDNWRQEIVAINFKVQWRESYSVFELYLRHFFTFHKCLEVPLNSFQFINWRDVRWSSKNSNTLVTQTQWNLFILFLPFLWTIMSNWIFNENILLRRKLHIHEILMVALFKFSTRFVASATNSTIENGIMHFSCTT